MRNTRRKQTHVQPQQVMPIMPSYVHKFRDFVEVPADAEFNGEGRVIEAVAGRRRFIWADVLHELPSKGSPTGNTIIVPVRKRHFIDLVWRQ